MKEVRGKTKRYSINPVLYKMSKSYKKSGEINMKNNSIQEALDIALEENNRLRNVIEKIKEYCRENERRNKRK